MNSPVMDGVGMEEDVRLLRTKTCFYIFLCQRPWYLKQPAALVDMGPSGPIHVVRSLRWSCSPSASPRLRWP